MDGIFFFALGQIGGWRIRANEAGLVVKELKSRREIFPAAAIGRDNLVEAMRYSCERHWGADGGGGREGERQILGHEIYTEPTRISTRGRHSLHYTGDGIVGIRGPTTRGRGVKYSRQQLWIQSQSHAEVHS